MFRNTTAVPGLTILALCAMIADAEAQQTGGAMRAAPVTAGKSIPWDEPGKPAGVPAIDAYSATKGSNRELARDGHHAPRRRRASEASIGQQQEPGAGARAGRRSVPKEAAPQAQAAIKQRNEAAEADEAESRRVEALKETRAKAEMEARARAEAEAEARARTIAQIRAKALAEEQRRLEAEKSRDRFAPRSEPQPLNEARSTPSAPLLASGAAQARTPAQLDTAPTAAKPAHESPESTGSILGRRDLGETEPKHAPAAVEQPPASAVSEASWTHRVCKRLFFGLLGC